MDGQMSSPTSSGAGKGILWPTLQHIQCSEFLMAFTSYMGFMGNAEASLRASLRGLYSKFECMSYAAMQSSIQRDNKTCELVCI